MKVVTLYGGPLNLDKIGRSKVQHLSRIEATIIDKADAFPSKFINYDQVVKHETVNYIRKTDTMYVYEDETHRYNAWKRTKRIDRYFIQSMVDRLDEILFYYFYTDIDREAMYMLSHIYADNFMLHEKEFYITQDFNSMYYTLNGVYHIYDLN